MQSHISVVSDVIFLVRCVHNIVPRTLEAQDYDMELQVIEGRDEILTYCIISEEDWPFKLWDSVLIDGGMEVHFGFSLMH